MAHPNARLIPIADFTKAVLQAPAFLRAAGAAEIMEDLVISLQGRPVPRKGYAIVETSELSIGTAAGEYAEDDQLAVVHWLGDDDTPEGVKRMYYFPRHASWVQDEVGRLLYLVGKDMDPKIIDLKDNIAYNWVMTAPGVVPGSGASFNMTGPPDLNVNRDLPLIASDEVEQGGIHIIWPQPATAGVYIDIRATTDITYVTLDIHDVAGNLIRQLYDGRLAQGGHRFFWDGRNNAGNVVAPGIYVAKFEIDADATERKVDNLKDTQNFAIVGASAAPSTYYLSGQFRYVCYTYANEDLNLESLPSFIAKERIFFWHVDDEDAPDFRVVTAIATQDAPDWAKQINIYVSEEPTPPEAEDITSDYTAIETGFDFRKIGALKKLSNGNFDTILSDYAGQLTQSSQLLDSYEHDGPVDGLHVIGAYGIGLWGAAKNRVYFSKIGNFGEQRLYALPSENALIPHSFPLPRSGQSPILHIHPAAHESALLVFKRDALHIIKGSGLISGLYDPETIVEVDVDASHVIEGIGTMSGRSVLTVGSAVYFVGSDNQFYQYGTDWRGRTDVRDVGLPIQKYLDALDVDALENLVAFLYKNCYHLITAERVIILDMDRKYWTAASWRLKDAFWSRGGLRAESILYGVRRDGVLIELFKGDTDDGDVIGGVWQSNPIVVPSESSITGVLCVHTTTPTPTLTCRVDIDDVEGNAEEFYPDKSNDFRLGTFGSGSRVAVRLQSDEGFPLCDRIQLEIFIVP